MKALRAIAVFGIAILVMLMVLSFLWYFDGNDGSIGEYSEKMYYKVRYEISNLPDLEYDPDAYIKVDFSRKIGENILGHGANEASAIGVRRERIVDQYRNDLGFSTMRYWLWKPWWKSKYGEPTTLPSDFYDDPDLRTIDGMLREAKGTGAELTFVIAHAPDHLLPKGADTETKFKNRIGIHNDGYPAFRSYVMDLVEYILYDSPDAIGNDRVVIEIWNEPEEETFDNIGMSYADLINDIGLELVDRYPRITIAANVFPYFEGFPANDLTEDFYRELDDNLVPHFRATYHLYNNYYSRERMASFFANSDRLFLEGPQRLREYLRTLGGDKADIPLYIGEHNLHTDKKYAYEMAGEEGAGILALNIINMIRGGELQGHQFYKFASLEDNGFGLIDIEGWRFPTFPVMEGFIEAAPVGADLFYVLDHEELRALATGVGDERYLIIVNAGSRDHQDVPINVAGVNIDGFENLVTGKMEEREMLDFEPFEVKILKILS